MPVNPHTPSYAAISCLTRCFYGRTTPATLSFITTKCTRHDRPAQGEPLRATHVSMTTHTHNHSTRGWVPRTRFGAPHTSKYQSQNMSHAFRTQGNDPGCVVAKQGPPSPQVKQPQQPNACREEGRTTMGGGGGGAASRLFSSECAKFVGMKYCSC